MSVCTHKRSIIRRGCLYASKFHATIVQVVKRTEFSREICSIPPARLLDSWSPSVFATRLISCHRDATPLFEFKCPVQRPCYCWQIQIYSFFRRTVPPTLSTTHRATESIVCIVITLRLTTSLPLGGHFDVVYALPPAGCAAGRYRVRIRVGRGGPRLLHHASHFHSNSLEHLPIPVANLPSNTFIPVGHVACLFHITSTPIGDGAYMCVPIHVLLREDDETLSKNRAAQLLAAV